MQVRPPLFRSFDLPATTHSLASSLLFYLIVNLYFVGALTGGLSAVVILIGVVAVFLIRRAQRRAVATIDHDAVYQTGSYPTVLSAIWVEFMEVSTCTHAYRCCV